MVAPGAKIGYRRSNLNSNCSFSALNFKDILLTVLSRRRLLSKSVCRTLSPLAVTRENLRTVIESGELAMKPKMWIAATSIDGTNVVGYKQYNSWRANIFFRAALCESNRIWNGLNPGNILVPRLVGHQEIDHDRFKFLKQNKFIALRSQSDCRIQILPTG